MKTGMPSRWTSVLTAVLVAAVFMVTPSSILAASARGIVHAVVNERGAADSIVRKALQAKEGDGGGRSALCEKVGDVAGLVVIKGRMPRRVKEGQAVILKAGGTGKVMGTVVKTLGDSDDLCALARCLAASDANVLWVGEGGECCLVKTKKAFLPEAGEKVRMKLKSARPRVEGC